VEAAVARDRVRKVGRCFWRAHAAAVLTDVQELGSAFRVRFRDYPEEGVLMRRRENIALLYAPEPESAPQAA